MIEMNENEKWVLVDGTNGTYSISNYGRLLSRNPHYKTERLINGNITTDGYRQYNICINGKKSHYAAHRLVAIHFIPNTDYKPMVNHIDRNRTNNHVDNLEWATSRENINHSRNIIGNWNFEGGKRIVQMTLDKGEFLAEYKNAKFAAMLLFPEYKSAKDMLQCAGRGKIKSAFGYKWIYKELMIP